VTRPSARAAYALLSRARRGNIRRKISHKDNVLLKVESTARRCAALMRWWGGKGHRLQLLGFLFRSPSDGERRAESAFCKPSRDRSEKGRLVYTAIFSAAWRQDGRRPPRSKRTYHWPTGTFE